MKAKDPKKVAAGKARAAQFTPDYQRQALYKRNEKWGGYWLSEWGRKGFYRQMQAAGFTDTVLMEQMRLKFGD